MKRFTKITEKSQLGIVYKFYKFSLLIFKEFKPI